MADQHLDSKLKDLITAADRIDPSIKNRTEQYKFIREKFQDRDYTFIYYPASLADIIPIFAFRKTSKFVYQDHKLEDEYYLNFETKEKMRIGAIERFEEKLRGLSEKGFVRNYRIRKRFFREILDLQFEALDLEEGGYLKKEIIAYYGKNLGDMEKYVPREARMADIVYLNSMHLYPSVVPHLKVGAVIRGSTTIQPKYYFFYPIPNDEVEKLGLEIIEIDPKDTFSAIFRKVRN